MTEQLLVHERGCNRKVSASIVSKESCYYVTITDIDASYG